MSWVWDSLCQILCVVFIDCYVLVVMIGVVVLYLFFYLVVYWYQVVGNLLIVVVDLDQSVISCELLCCVDVFNVVCIVGQLVSLDQVCCVMEVGYVEGILFILDWLECDILCGGSGDLVLIGNGVYLGCVSWVMVGVVEVLGVFGCDVVVVQVVFMGLLQLLLICLVQCLLYNIYEGYGSVIVVGVVELIVYQILLMGIGVLLGICCLVLGWCLCFDLLMLFGMVVGFWLIGMFGLFYYVGFIVWVQDYLCGGNFVGVFVGGVLFIVVIVVFGMFIGSFFCICECVF